MKVAVPTLQFVFDGWENYQRLLLRAVRPLTAAQMALRPAPGQWAIWQIGSHMAGARAYWLHDFLGEGEQALRDMFRVTETSVPGLSLSEAGWEDDERHPRSAAEVAGALERTWSLIAGCVGRWASDELEVEFSRDRPRGRQYFTRAWVIWHLIEHDLHHGGEISSTLGGHGLPTPDL